MTQRVGMMTEIVYSVSDLIDRLGGTKLVALDIERTKPYVTQLRSAQSIPLIHQPTLVKRALDNGFIIDELLLGEAAIEMQRSRIARAKLVEIMEDMKS